MNVTLLYDFSCIAFVVVLVSVIALAVILALTVTGFTIGITVLRRAKKIPKTSLSRTQVARKYKPTVRFSGVTGGLKSTAAAADNLESAPTENVDYEPEPVSTMAAAINTNTDAEEEDIEINYEPIAVPLSTNTNISYALHAR